MTTPKPDLALPRRVALPPYPLAQADRAFLESARAFVAAHWSIAQAARQPAAARAA
ncbi:MAG: hypothetical protein ACKOZX_11095 [Gammaproteobacteria bacterium]